MSIDTTFINIFNYHPTRSHSFLPSKFTLHFSETVKTGLQKILTDMLTCYNLQYTKFLKIILFIQAFLNFKYLVVLGLHCCMSFSLVALSRGYSLAEMCGRLSVVVSLVAKPVLCNPGARASEAAARRRSSCGSKTLRHRFSGCGAQAWLLCSM